MSKSNIIELVGIKQELIMSAADSAEKILQSMNNFATNGYRSVGPDNESQARLNDTQ
jgi:hypothetical protein